MRNFLLELVRIWRGNGWNKAGTLLIAGGVLSVNGVAQYLIPSIGRVFKLQISIPETPLWVSFLLIALGILMFVLSRVLPDRSIQSAPSSSPRVKAIINRERYPGGWRSVGLHIMPPPGQESSFRFTKRGWRIDGAELLSPMDAVLARAKDDDYATGEFYPEKPMRSLNGRPIGHVQPFGLEFFIKFDGATDKERKAKFRVKLNHTEDPKLRHSIKVWTRVPSDTN
jgi:hypothetical protein